MAGSDELIALAAQYNAAVERVKGKDAPGREDLDTFLADLANVVQGLIVIVASHVAQPFTKAHDRGRDE
jgi:hypothetical protein